MKLVLLITVFLFFACSPKNDKQKINECFRNYINAAKDNDGITAANMINKTSIQYYDHLLYFIQSADSQEIEKLSYIDKITLLTVRHIMTKEDIVAIPDGKKLFSIMIDSGMTNIDTSAFQLIDIQINDKHAKAIARKDNSNIVLDLEFENENGKWLFDISSLLNNIKSKTEALREEKTSDENENLLLLLHIEYNKKPSPDIWKPLITR